MPSGLDRAGFMDADVCGICGNYSLPRPQERGDGSQVCDGAADKKVNIPNRVHTYAEKKIGKLEKYFKEEPEATVTFAVEKKNRCIVEVMLRGANGTLFRAVCEDADGDMRGAIDEATAQIERKIRKNKTRLAKNLRAEAVLPELPEEFEAHEEGAFDIVRTKRFTVKPMSVEEAILQMDLLGHSFFLYHSTENDKIQVVYRRADGGYGVLIPEA